MVLAHQSRRPAGSEAAQGERVEGAVSCLKSLSRNLAKAGEVWRLRSEPMRKRLPIYFLMSLIPIRAIAGTSPGAAEFRKDIQPILETYCFDCHADGVNKGGVAFDEFNPDHAPAESRTLWWRVLKNLRAGLMPPEKKPQPTKAEREKIQHWIKNTAFEIDPQSPDPGRVTIRRLNRVEYRNT